MMKKHKLLIAYAGWMVLQAILLCVFQNVEQYRDTIGAMSNAMYCIEHGVTSPNTSNVYQLYIQAPGFTNYLAAVYALFGTFKAAQWLALVMNGVILAEVYYVARHFYAERVATIAAMLYGVMLSNVFASVYILSEVPFLFLSLSGFCLMLRGGSGRYAFAGLLFAMAYTMKPLVLAFLIAAVVLLIARRGQVKHYVALLLPYFLALQLYASYNEHTMGYRVMTSTTGGFNLCLSTSAPNPLWGAFQNPDHCGYIANEQEYTFVQRDSIRTRHAVEHIMAHSLDYIGICLRKPFWLFFMDSWSIPPLVGIDDYQYAAKADNPQMAHRVLYLLRCCWSIPYYIVCALFLFSLWKRRKDILSERGLLLLIALLGIGATCIFTVEERYHYPYMFVFAIWGASLFERNHHTAKQ